MQLVLPAAGARLYRRFTSIVVALAGGFIGALLASGVGVGDLAAAGDERPPSDQQAALTLAGHLSQRTAAARSAPATDTGDTCAFGGFRTRLTKLPWLRAVA